MQSLRCATLLCASLVLVASFAPAPTQAQYLVAATYNSYTCNAAQVTSVSTYSANVCIPNGGTSVKYSCPERSASYWANANCEGNAEGSIAFPTGCMEAYPGSSNYQCLEVANPFGGEPIATSFTYTSLSSCSNSGAPTAKNFYYGGCIINPSNTSAEGLKFTCGETAFTKTVCEGSTCSANCATRASLPRTTSIVLLAL